MATQQEGRARAGGPAASCLASPDHVPNVRERTKGSPPQEKPHVRIPPNMIPAAQERPCPGTVAKRPQGRELGLLLDCSEPGYKA